MTTSLSELDTYNSTFHRIACRAFAAATAFDRLLPRPPPFERIRPVPTAARRIAKARTVAALELRRAS